MRGNESKPFEDNEVEPQNIEKVKLDYDFCTWYDVYASCQPSALLVNVLSREVALNYYQLVRLPNFRNVIDSGRGMYLNKYVQDRICIDARNLEPSMRPRVSNFAVDNVDNQRVMFRAIGSLEEGNFREASMYVDTTTTEARGAYKICAFRPPFQFVRQYETEIIPSVCGCTKLSQGVYSEPKI